MNIDNSILKHYLRNCYFINGTAYAGKSTMCAMMAERFDMVLCEENYNLDTILSIANPDRHPNICYMNTKPSWEHFVSRSPEEYAAWIDGNNWELAEFEIAELIRLSADRKVIVDTNIPTEILWQISDYNHVAIMLSPQAMSAERFFDRKDPEKQFLLSVIENCPNPKATLENFKNCISTVNSPECYCAFLNSGFFTLIRPDDGRDSREEMLTALAAHFGLME